ncbi:hypothetical protein SMICM17S_11734 [Streptomyces microflavus]
MTASHLLVPVPIPDRVAALIGSCIPPHILEAEFEADCAAREVRRFRGPGWASRTRPTANRPCPNWPAPTRSWPLITPGWRWVPARSPDRTWAHRTARCRSRARRGPGRGRQG